MCTGQFLALVLIRDVLVTVEDGYEQPCCHHHSGRRTELAGFQGLADVASESL